MKNVWKEEKTSFRVENFGAGAASSPNLGAQQGCVQELSLHPSLFVLISLDMGSDIWVRPLGPVAPQGVAWMHFPNVAEALRYLRSEEGGSLRTQHTQVTRVAKANATGDGYAFTFDKPSSLVVASVARSRRTATALAPNLSTFGFKAVRCACCGANICGTKHSQCAGGDYGTFPYCVRNPAVLCSRNR